MNLIELTILFSTKIPLFILCVKHCENNFAESSETMFEAAMENAWVYTGEKKSPSSPSLILLRTCWLNMFRNLPAAAGIARIL
jgi:hypothetical protein